MQKGYEWLSKVSGPKALLEAIALLGTTEAPGKADNATILSWAKELGGKTALNYNRDEIPWCGLFVGVCIKRGGFEPVTNPLWALSWSAYGRAIALPGEAPALGDVLVFTRSGGGHVGFYVGEDMTAYHVLGGNQDNKVCVKRIDKKRLYGARRSIWKKSQPSAVKRVWLSQIGELSTNEA